MPFVIPGREKSQLLRLRRNGNSLIVPLPKVLLRWLRWKRGDFVAAVVDGDVLKVAKIDVVKMSQEVIW